MDYIGHLNKAAHKDLTVTQDETFTGGLCLITMDPESNFLTFPLCCFD
jgi:hypothetical protein